MCKNAINQRFIKAINSLLKDKKLTKSSVAESLGIKPAKFSEILNSRMNVGTDTIALLCEKYSFSASWILNEQGTMLVPGVLKGRSKPSIAIGKIPDDYNKIGTKGIPLIPIEAVAGFPTNDSDGVYMEDCEHYHIPEFESRGAKFLIRVSGDSMLPLYKSGDVLACRKLNDILFFQWGNVYLLDTSQGSLVKYVEQCEENNDYVQCVSENEKYKPFLLPKSDIRSLSMIIGLIRIV